MAEYEALKNKTVKVTNIKNRSYEKDDQLLVDRVILEVEDKEIPKGKISINPKLRETEIKTTKVNDLEMSNEIETKRDPTVRELSTEFPYINQLFKAVEEYGEIEITGLIRAVRDSPEDDYNFFIRANELDKLEASQVSEEEGISENEEPEEPVEEEGKAEESNDVLFGGEE